MPCVEHWRNVAQGERIGRILNSLDGQMLQDVRAPIHGMVFTLREYPVVSCGSLIARVLGGDFQ